MKRQEVIKLLSQEADTIDGFTFVWFTDGIGWKSARGNLRETFEVLDTMYSIDDMENGVIKKKVSVRGKKDGI